MLPPIRTPFLSINPKAYLTGADTLRLAAIADELAGRLDIDIIFTAQHVNLAQLAAQTSRLLVTAQHMDPITLGRGMGYILPEALVEAGARAVVLNHAEHPLTLAELDATMRRADEVGLATIVCADSIRQCQALAHFGPAAMICEPTALIGTGQMGDTGYVRDSIEAVKGIDPSIRVIAAAGVTCGADITRVLEAGADGSGGTSGIVQAPDWRAVLTDMAGAVAAFRDSQTTAPHTTSQ
ncbi:MAG: triose-phosphate isomerase [Actinobacteria bacterium]|nr:triose-phosphate isomerase [Actinomycetota bacterium]